MNIQEINNQLKKIYIDFYDQLKKCKNSLPSNTSCPLFMNVFDEYLSKELKFKILIVGQETNGWGSLENNKEITEILSWYSSFQLGKNANIDGSYLRRPYLISPFWNFSRSFFGKINNIDKKINGFLWTNISKFDIGTTSPEEKYRLPDGFRLLRKEVKIIKPDIVIFLTGNQYDYQISKDLNLKINLVNDELNISKLIDESEEFPKNTFKVFHPRAMYAKGTHIKVEEELIRLITTS